MASLRDVHVLTAGIAGQPAELHGLIAPTFRPLLAYATPDKSMVGDGWVDATVVNSCCTILKVCLGFYNCCCSQFAVRFFSIGKHQSLPNDFSVASPPLAIECNKHVVAIVRIPCSTPFWLVPHPSP